MLKQEVKYPSLFIKLPSKGLVYPKDSVYAKGEILLRYPTAEDLNILTSRPLIQKGKVLEVFVQNLVVDPTVDIELLVLGDMNACIIAARILAYGPDYHTKHKCENCDKLTLVIFNLNKIINKLVNLVMYLAGTNKFEMVLPTTKKKIVFKLITGKLNNLIKNSLKNQKTVGGVDTEVTSRLRSAIISVDGLLLRLKVNDFVRKMPSRDSLALRAYIRLIMPDINLDTTIQCTECELILELQVPIGYDFFYPTR